ncbi:hypothetical protein HAZT_HAZT003873 [Hyalella azteca]|uniref:Uncharacterized protein n=1 Tax=Hyalella azteca TaxID=294128 RepID=A0A6A0H264_HYAAZ|nr:hypothetical protein HAZT_HAZT003873 [Hyalella azteca]
MSLTPQRWVNANSACVWDVELVEAVASLKLVGALLGGWLLVSGPTRALATVLHAHTHSLLHPPVGYSIHALDRKSVQFLLSVVNNYGLPTRRSVARNAEKRSVKY